MRRWQVYLPLANLLRENIRISLSNVEVRPRAGGEGVRAGRMQAAIGAARRHECAGSPSATGWLPRATKPRKGLACRVWPRAAFDHAPHLTTCHI